MTYCIVLYFFVFKQKTAYELRISDWSSDVCSSDLSGLAKLTRTPATARTQYATASAIRILSEREAVFKTADVIKTAVDLGEKGVKPERIERRIAELVEKGEIVTETSPRLETAIDTHTQRAAHDQQRRNHKALDNSASHAMPRRATHGPDP